MLACSSCVCCVLRVFELFLFMLMGKGPLYSCVYSFMVFFCLGMGCLECLFSLLRDIIWLVRSFVIMDECLQLVLSKIKLNIIVL